MPIPPRAPTGVATAEAAVTVAMISVVIFTLLTSILSLRETSSEAGRAALARVEEQRLVDHLTRDFRHAVAAPTMDPDDQGFQIVLPDADRFDPGDAAHRFPLANAPATPGTQTVVYRFLHGSVTRTDPRLPLVRSDGSWVDGGPVTIATGMDDFPTIASDPLKGDKASVRYRVTIHPASVDDVDATIIAPAPGSRR